MKFERHFQYPLWASEKDHLADRLKVERPELYESYTESTSSISQQIEGPLRSSEQTAPQSDRNLDEGDETKENESTESCDEEETERALQWLGTEWKSLVEELKEIEPECELEDVY